MLAADVYTALTKRFAPPQWAIFPEVRGGTGWSENSGDSADAVAMSLWPSSGLEVHGFEIKITRSDWLREMKDPTKTEGVRRFCDRWWLVVPHPELVKPGELPVGWGLIVAGVDGVRVRVNAPKRDADALDRLFIAALLRAAHTAQDVEERQAQKAALLAAPMRTILRYNSAHHAVLSCGHTAPGWRRGRKAMRCLECGARG